MIVLKEYRRVPPKGFRDIVIEHLNKMPGVYCPCFDGAKLIVTNVVQPHTRLRRELDYLLIGLEDGYKAAMGPTKPYGLKYKKIVFPKMDREPYLDREVVEWFVVREEAHRRRLELSNEVRNKLATLGDSRPVLVQALAELYCEFSPQIVHSDDREHHF